MKKEAKTGMEPKEVGRFEFTFGDNVDSILVREVPNDGCPGDWRGLDRLLPDIIHYLNAGFTEFRNRKFGECGDAITRYIEKLRVKAAKTAFAQRIAEMLSVDDIRQVSAENVAEAVRVMAHGPAATDEAPKECKAKCKPQCKPQSKGQCKGQCRKTK